MKMTTKELVVVSPDRFISFKDMDIGDICRNREGKYFMKIESVRGDLSASANLTFNAVDLITGSVVWFADNDEVISAQSVKLSILL